MLFEHPTVLSAFLSTYSGGMSEDLVKKILTPILTSSKASNPLVHTGSVLAFAALVSGRTIPTSLYENIANDLLAPPKSGKTASPDHRVALYSMLSYLPPSSAVSSNIAFTLPALLAKESSEAVLPSLRDALALHLSYALKSDQTVPKDVTAILVKETAGTKSAVRRAFLHVVGKAFSPSEIEMVAGETEWSSSAKTLAEALLPSLEADLKGSVSAPLNAATGPMEGYVAIATFVHPSSPIPKPRKIYLLSDYHTPRRL